MNNTIPFQFIIACVGHISQVFWDMIWDKFK